MALRASGCLPEDNSLQTGDLLITNANAFGVTGFRGERLHWPARGVESCNRVRRLEREPPR